MGISQARADLERYAKGEWAVDIILTAPAPGSEVANIKGLSSLHHFQIDPETGMPVNTRNAHVSFTEKEVIAANANYPTRLGSELFFKDHFVEFADASGKTYKFKIDNQYPNETFDLIVCILGEYSDN